MSDQHQEQSTKWVIATNGGGWQLVWAGGVMFSSNVTQAVVFDTQHAAQEELETWVGEMRDAHQVMPLDVLAPPPDTSA